MKKCLLIVLVVLLLLSLAACKQEKELTFTFDQAVTDCQGLQVSAASTWEEEQLKLMLRMHNDTEQFVFFGSRFVVEREENGQWVQCQMREGVAWSDIGYFLEPGKSREDVYYVAFCYAIDEPGQYRFQMGLNLSEKTDMVGLNPDGDYKVIVEFTVDK